MDEKESNPLTIGDILDQLVKPSVIGGQATPPPRPVSPPMPALPSVSSGTNPEVKMPQLGKSQGESAVASPNSPAKSELRLSIRTMADDLEKLKRGQRVSPSEIQKMSVPVPIPRPTPPKPPPAPLAPKPTPKPVAPQPIPTFRAPLSTQPSALPPNIAALPPLRPTQPSAPPKPINPAPLKPLPTPMPTPTLPRQPSAPQMPSSRPVLPPVRPMTLPPISTSPTPQTGEPKHYHTEKVIGDELPPFLGAPIPKKARKPVKERIEYRLIAKIIGSGMTTGIIITLIMAGAAYGLIYFFYLKKAEVPVTTPTPSVGVSIAPVINELEIIFSSVAVINFELPNQKETAMPSLKSFINNQILAKKEFKKLNITLQSGPEQKISSFTDLMADLAINYPPELQNEINTNSLVLLYGQEELVTTQTESIPKKIVFIAEVKDVAKITQIMSTWEQTLPKDLKDLFDIDPSKQASPTFLNNEHRGVLIRYKNFPLPDKTIDYAIVSSLTNHHYLIITNSRESMYSPADKIRGL